MASHWHDPTAQTQNQGNRVGDRPCVRQSKLYRRYESGNQIKEMLGQGSLLWDEEKQQGAYAGQQVYDHLTADHSVALRGAPNPLTRSATFSGRPRTATSTSETRNQSPPPPSSASRDQPSKGRNAVAASWNGRLPSCGSPPQASESSAKSQNLSCPPIRSPPPLRPSSRSPPPLGRSATAAQLSRSVSASATGARSTQLRPADPTAREESKAEVKQLREEVRRLQRELDRDVLTVEVKKLRRENQELHDALDAVNPEDMDELEHLRHDFAKLASVADAYEGMLRALSKEHKFEFSPLDRPQAQPRDGSGEADGVGAALERASSAKQVPDEPDAGQRQASADAPSAQAAPKSQERGMDAVSSQGGRPRGGGEEGGGEAGSRAEAWAGGAKPMFEVGDRVALRWKAPGSAEGSLWPGRVCAKTPVVRVKVLSADQRLELVDMWATGHIHLAAERLMTRESDAMAGGGAFDHTVVLKTVAESNSVTTTTTHTLTLTNTSSRYRAGDTLTLSFTKAITGLPVRYAVDLEGAAGRREDVAQHMLERARDADRAPRPKPWPPCGMLGACVGSGSSALVWRNCCSSASGTAMHVRVCAEDDVRGTRPVASLFVHPEEETRQGAKLAPGRYRTWVAAGAKVQEGSGHGGEYYGEELLFGPAGQYFKCSELQLAPKTTLTIDFLGGNDCLPLEHMTW